jgi:hypothetical protein
MHQFGGNQFAQAHAVAIGVVKYSIKTNSYERSNKMRMLTKFMELSIGVVFISWFLWSLLMRPFKHHSGKAD